VGEVDQPQDAVDQRVTEGDQGVDRPQREAVDRLWSELIDKAPEAGVDELPPQGGDEGSRRPSAGV
jgi:hypothetical protein